MFTPRSAFSGFSVGDTGQAVAELTQRGVQFERYARILHQDDTGIMRGRAHFMGSDTAWCKNPAGNILAVLQDA